VFRVLRSPRCPILRDPLSHGVEMLAENGAECNRMEAPHIPRRDNRACAAMENMALLVLDAFSPPHTTRRRSASGGPEW
jgi:hypothetical protein